MNEKHRTRVSKRLSRHLRHDPAGLGLTLAPGGWVPVADLLAALTRNRMPVSRAELDEVVALCAKQRFSFDETGTLIRANQGHSAAVDLELPDASPPEILYHGTATRFLPAIWSEGLRPMKRHAVHLSPSRETAVKVGTRHGKPVVLTVAAAEMAEQGYVFQVSDNGVWLTAAVPAEFLATEFPATEFRAAEFGTAGFGTAEFGTAEFGTAEFGRAGFGTVGLGAAQFRDGEE